MRQILALLLALLLTAPARAYENPILGPINDPDAIAIDGRFHLIVPNGVGAKAGFDYRWSKDLVHWSPPVRILQQPAGTQLWQGYYDRAPDGQLYLYSAAVTGKDDKVVRVARAASVTGPFTDLGVVATHAIDPYPFRDKDGTLWLYYKDDRKGQKGIWVIRMADALTPAAPPVEVLHPRPGTFEDNGYLTVEGPTLIERAGKYFLLYSGGPFDQPTYAVGYAVADSPAGPFTRAPNNPLMSVTRTPGVFSPGVPDVVRDGAGHSWLVYRQRQDATRKSPRMLTIDPLDDTQAAQGVLRAQPTAGEVEADPVPLP